MKVVRHSAGIFGIPEWANMEFPGYNLDPNDPRLPLEIATYVFRKELVRIISFVWARELGRKPADRKLGLLLTGPKGAGKTTVIEQFFQRLRVPVFHYTANRHTELGDLIESRTLVDGSILPVEGPLLTAMRLGCVFVLNELNLMDPSILTGLNDAIERGMVTTSTGQVVAKKGFIFMATVNGVGEDSDHYAGTNVMNQALLSRFVTARVDFPSADEELQILTASVPKLVGAIAKKMIEVASIVRSNDAMDTTISTRELITWGELMVAFQGLSKSGEDPVTFTLNATTGNACDPASRETLHQLAQRVFGQTSA